MSVRWFVHRPKFFYEIPTPYIHFTTKSRGPAIRFLIGPGSSYSTGPAGLKKRRTGRGGSLAKLFGLTRPEIKLKTSTPMVVFLQLAAIIKNS